jgi:hypothetical protein
MGQHTDTKGKNIGQESKRKRDSLPRRSQQEILQHAAGRSGASSRGTGTTSEPANCVFTQGRDKLIMRNLPEVTSRTSLSGLSSSDTPVQGASSSSTPAEGKGMRHLASGMGRLHLVMTKLPECATRKVKKARACRAGMGAPSNQGESRHA